MIQFARLSGFTNIITTASPRNEDLLITLGATHVIDRTLKPVDILAQVRSITKDEIRIVHDAVSTAETQNIGYDIVASGGTLVLTSPSEIDQTKLDPTKKVHMTNGAVGLPFWVALDTELFELLPSLLDSGDVKVSAVEGNVS